VFDFNQGLMDLGATVCAPRTPRCGGCPMKGFCRTSPHKRAPRNPRSV
jgi:A/G-specific adenine glycosylase